MFGLEFWLSLAVVSLLAYGSFVTMILYTLLRAIKAQDAEMVTLREQNRLLGRLAGKAVA